MVNSIEASTRLSTIIDIKWVTNDFGKRRRNTSAVSAVVRLSGNKVTQVRSLCIRGATALCGTSNSELGKLQEPQTPKKGPQKDTKTLDLKREMNSDRIVYDSLLAAKRDFTHSALGAVSAVGQRRRAAAVIADADARASGRGQPHVRGTTFLINMEPELGAKLENVSKVEAAQTLSAQLSGAEDPNWDAGTMLHQQMKIVHESTRFSTEQRPG